MVKNKTRLTQSDYMTASVPTTSCPWGICPQEDTMPGQLPENHEISEITNVTSSLAPEDFHFGPPCALVYLAS